MTALATQIIEREKIERTGYLDLGMCGQWGRIMVCLRTHRALPYADDVALSGLSAKNAMYAKKTSTNRAPLFYKRLKISQ